MDINYKGENFTIDDYLVNKRINCIFDTKEGIEALIQSYMECEYGNNIEFYIERYGKKHIEADLNEYLCVELEMYSPVDK